MIRSSSSVTVRVIGSLLVRFQPLTVTLETWLAVLIVGLNSISERPHANSNITSRRPGIIPGFDGPKNSCRSRPSASSASCTNIT